MKISVLELLAKTYISRDPIQGKLDEIDLVSSTIVLSSIAHSLSLVHGTKLSRNDRELIVLKFGQGLRDSVEFVTGVNLTPVMSNYMEAQNAQDDSEGSLLHLLGRTFFTSSEPIDCDPDDLVNSLLILNSTCKWHFLRRAKFLHTERVREEWRIFQSRMKEILSEFTGMNPDVAVLSKSWWLNAIRAPIN